MVFKEKGDFSMADIKDIIKQLGGNKDLMKQISKADLSQAKDLLKKANINLSDEDIKKVQAALADGKLDFGEIKDLAGTLLK